MNDRFKFRVWSKEDCGYMESNDIFRLTHGGKLVFNNDGLNREPECNPKRFICEQCTGLKDKNGELIYENDIIDTPNGVYRVAVDDFGLWTAIYKGNPLKDVVEWSDIVKNYAFNRENVEIVILGNVHENKELLDE